MENNLMEQEPNIETQTNVLVEGKNIDVVIKNTKSQNWYDDINILKENNIHKIDKCYIDVTKNYEISNMIASYHSFVEYHNMLVLTISNKPMNIAYLKVLDFDDILVSIERIEKDVSILRLKIKKLELEIKSRIYDYIDQKLITIEEKSFSKTVNKAISNMFKFKKHDAEWHAVNSTVENSIIKY